MVVSSDPTWTAHRLRLRCKRDRYVAYKAVQSRHTYDKDPDHNKYGALPCTDIAVMEIVVDGGVSFTDSRAVSHNRLGENVCVFSRGIELDRGLWER